MTSSYDAAVVDTAMIEWEAMLTLPRGVRLLHLEALVWSKLHRTDGRIPATALSRLTDEPDPSKATRDLVRVGLWQATDTGWLIVGFTDTQMSAQRVQQQQQAAAARYDKWRGQHPEHPKGKHPSNGVGNGVANDSARPPARPPAREEAAGGGGTPPGLEPAAAASLDSVSCDDYPGHQSSHRLFSEGWRCVVCVERRQRRELGRIIREAPVQLRKRHLVSFERRYPAYPASSRRHNQQRIHPALKTMVRTGQVSA